MNSVANLLVEDGDSRQYVRRAERVSKHLLCVVVVVGEEERVTRVLSLDGGDGDDRGITGSNSGGTGEEGAEGRRGRESREASSSRV